MHSMLEKYSPYRQNGLVSTAPKPPQTPSSRPSPPPSPRPQAPGPESRSFQTKSLNIMDPLLPTNNLGRSVSKASFARIRIALAYGSKRLTEIMAMVSFACKIA